ncbi:MAG: MFS transporter [Chloroflexi bacterium]|nr:MFS transporter [Chloroflexota bacterium]
MLAVVPFQVVHLGGAPGEIGLTLGVFALSAMVGRPFVGVLLDRERHRALLVGGGTVFATASFLYIAADTIGALIAVRAFHGIGMALTATTVPLLADRLAPPGRRGEAIALQYSAQVLAGGVAPAIGYALAQSAGPSAVFAWSGALGTLGAIVAARIAVPRRDRGTEASDPPVRGPLPWDRSAVPVGALLGVAQIGYGAVTSFVPIQAGVAGLQNAGLYFTAFSAAMIAGQIAGGRASDRFGRVWVIAPGLALGGLGVLLTPFLPEWSLLFGAALFGLGLGSSTTALFAAAVDRAAPGRAGVAMGTAGVLLELGIGGGSIATGAVSQFAGLPTAFFLAGITGLIGAAVAPLALRRRR